MPRGDRKRTGRTWRLTQGDSTISISSFGDHQRLLIEIESAGMINGVLLTKDEAQEVVGAIFRAIQR